MRAKKQNCEGGGESDEERGLNDLALLSLLRILPKKKKEKIFLVVNSKRYFLLPPLPFAYYESELYV